MQPQKLYAPARIIPAPLPVRLGRAARRIGMAPGATALSPAGAMMTIGLEAIVLTPYWDSARPPVLTIGCGHTAAAGAPDPATQWHVTWTIGQACAHFEEDARRYVAGVLRAFTRSLSQAQLDAAFDFNYHTGRIEVANWVKLFNAGQDAAAEQSLLANWRSQPSRTDAERQLFFDGKYAGDGTALLVPANGRGLLNWAGASRVDLHPYFPARRAA
jgi:GH24 family phage-related lysozyme (muramidase)